MAVGMFTILHAVGQQVLPLFNVKSGNTIYICQKAGDSIVQVNERARVRSGIKRNVKITEVNKERG